MSIITLTSDYGTKDHFISSVKGFIYANSKSVNIVDISHEIDPFNIGQCAYIFRNSYPNFADNTIHIIGLDSEISGEKKHVIAKVNNQYFIGTDNGVFSIIFQSKKIEKIIQIEFNNELKDSRFPMLHIFARIACQITDGIEIEKFGKQISSFMYNKVSQPIIKIDDFDKKRTIVAEIIYIDRFGNAITNISKDFFSKNIQDKAFTILVRRNQKIQVISKKYSDVEEGDILAIFNSAELLEISIMRRNTSEIGANKLLGINEKDSILIDF